MKRAFPIGWLVGGLVAVSVLFFVLDFAIYRDARDLIFYTLLDIAFIPINVLIVGLFINRLLQARERDELLHKMNMVVGAFFSSTGSDIIARLCAFDTDIEHDRSHMLFTTHWTPHDFEEHREAVRTEKHPMDANAGELVALREALEAQRPFILGLLQNGNLLEHGTFTDMLWAVSHLSEELSARCDLAALPEPDRAHIEIDMARAYGRLLGEWLLYVRHLKSNYPYLYSFAVRTNPFDQDAAVEVCTL
jgi:hypothetical protein